MGINDKSGVTSETWEESETKVRVFLQEELGLETKSLLREHMGSKRKKREKEGSL